MSDVGEFVSYYKQRSKKGLWDVNQGAQGCTIEDVEALSLSTQRMPPALPAQVAPKVESAPKSSPVKQKSKGFIESALDFRDWLNTPSPPKSPLVATPAKPKRPPVKPFDLQDIPDAMERIGWPLSAKLQRKWFSGELNYADTDDGARDGINQEGSPFPQSAIDTTMFKMDWILSFARAKERYEELIKKRVYSIQARNKLASILSRGRPSTKIFDTWKISGADMRMYHRNYQFQFNAVDSDNADKFLMFAKGAVLPSGALMDDLYGALGAFSFYAAVSDYTYDAIGRTRASIIIGKICVYMRDVFTFHDRVGKSAGPVRKGTQYLGHWNKTGFIIVPVATALGEVTSADWVNYPVARGGIISDPTVYYPVRNKDYRNWQLKHKRGGDLILYSDRRVITLPTPIVVEYDL